MTGLLEGRVALVTGAARAQGRSHAIALAAEGADILALDACGPVSDVGYDPATPEDLAETAASVEATGRRIISSIGDVRDQAALDALVREGTTQFGRLDVVVANAGVSSWGRFWEVAESRWLDTIDINLTGAWRTLRAAAPVMIDQGTGGSIITISSVSGMKALPGQAHYSASKHGLVGLTKTAAIELGPYGIRVNSVHPWGVDTPMAHDRELPGVLEAHPEFLASFGSVMPQVVLSEPADISDVVVFLASDASRDITGAQLTADRGATLV